jgi:uncharacterized protein YdcH (DUF465 family)
MFEYEQDIVEKLLDADHDFKSLFDRHAVLKEQVRSAETGELALEDTRLAALKKEKLLAKDKMAVMIARYRRTHPFSAAPRAAIP